MSVLPAPSSMERAECGLHGQLDPGSLIKRLRAEGRAGNIPWQGSEQSIQEINHPQSKSKSIQKKWTERGLQSPSVLPVWLR